MVSEPVGRVARSAAKEYPEIEPNVRLLDGR